MNGVLCGSGKRQRGAENEEEREKSGEEGREKGGEAEKGALLALGEGRLELLQVILYENLFDLKHVGNGTDYAQRSLLVIVKQSCSNFYRFRSFLFKSKSM